MTFDTHIQQALDDLERAGLLRHPRALSGPQGPEISIDGRPVLGLCSNNYLGLADHPHIVAAATEALGRLGVGAAASRHISGTSIVHRQAEQRLAQLVDLPAALLFTSGYAANLGAIQAIAGSGDALFSDALNHASLIDGARLSRAQVYIYRHRDPDHLAFLLERHRREHRNALVITESLFSMDGDLAPLPALRSLSQRYESGLLVDEAHALGVLGPSGSGLCRATGVLPDLLIGTLGKAFGCSGAFVASSRPTLALVENRARSYVFSTAPPPLLAATAIAAADLVESADDRRVTLLAHARALRKGLQALGYDAQGDDQAPIIPVLIGPAQTAMALSAALLERGVFVHGIRPPTVPSGTSRLRATAIATHTREQIERSLHAFKDVRNLL